MVPETYSTIPRGKMRSLHRRGNAWSI